MRRIHLADVAGHTLCGLFGRHHDVTVLDTAATCKRCLAAMCKIIRKGI